MPKKTLSKEEENALFLSYQEGNIKARDKIVEKNLSLVWAQVHKFKNKRIGFVSLEDIYSYGCLGLLKSIDEFKLGKGKFSTYAVYHIKKQIIHNMRKEGFLITIPEYKLREIYEFSKKGDKLKQTENESQVPPNYFVEVMALKNIVALRNGFDQDFINGFYLNIEYLNIETPSFLYEKDKKETFINNLLNSLDSNEKFILKSLYGIESKKLTVKQIMEISDYSRETINNIKEQAFRKIKRNNDVNVLAEMLENTE